MADTNSSEEFDNTLKKMKELSKENREIFCRISEMKNSNAQVVIFEELCLDSDANNFFKLNIKKYTTSASTIIAAWKPRQPVSFQNLKEFTFFNDNIDFDVRSFESLDMLNEKMTTLAEKFSYLDKSKVIPILKAILGNLEVVHTLLCQVESSLLGLGVVELMREVEDLNAKAKALKEKVAAWNVKKENVTAWDEKKLSQVNGLLDVFPRDWLSGKTIQPEPLYRATRDGWRLDDFHRCVDNKGATLLIARTSLGFVIGGYTSKSWDKNKTGKIETKESWIFILDAKEWTPTMIPTTFEEVGIVGKEVAFGN